MLMQLQNHIIKITLSQKNGSNNALQQCYFLLLISSSRFADVALLCNTKAEGNAVVFGFVKAVASSQELVLLTARARLKLRSLVSRVLCLNNLSRLCQLEIIIHSQKASKWDLACTAVAGNAARLHIILSFLPLQHSAEAQP